MSLEAEKVLDALRQAYPTSHFRLLLEPAMFVRSNKGRTYSARGAEVFSVKSALDYTHVRMEIVTERVRETPEYTLDTDHPWIIGVYPGTTEQHPHVFVHGNIIRNGDERWVEVGSIQYDRL
jgi:hypothetical protein